MSEVKLRAAVIGCGRMGQVYAEAFAAYPDTELVAIAEVNADRRRAVGERFGVTALYPDAEALLRDAGHDLRHALEVSIAARQSVCGNSSPVRLPLEDRTLSLYPRLYRWAGGDVSGRPQSVEEARGG